MTLVSFLPHKKTFLKQLKPQHIAFNEILYDLSFNRNLFVNPHVHTNRDIETARPTYNILILGLWENRVPFFSRY